MAKLNLGHVVGDKGEKGDSVSGVTLKEGTHAPGTTDTYQVELDNGETAGTFEVYNGQDGEAGTPGEPGAKGDKGETGASIKSVTLKSGTHDPGTTDVYNVTLDTGTVAGTFSVYNGTQGPKGDIGETGPQGEQGVKGDNGDPGKDATINGVNAVEIAGAGGVTVSTAAETVTISTPMWVGFDDAGKFCIFEEDEA